MMQDSLEYVVNLLDQWSHYGHTGHLKNKERRKSLIRWWLWVGS